MWLADDSIESRSFQAKHVITERVYFSNVIKSIIFGTKSSGNMQGPVEVYKFYNKGQRSTIKP